MTSRLRAVAGAVLSVALIALWVPSARADEKEDIAKAKALDGKYDVKGTNPDGSTYEGTCTIAHARKNVVNVTWKFGNRSDTGTGTVEGDTLTVEYEGAIKKSREGKAVYKIKDGNELKGTWKDAGSKKGTEDMTPKK